MNSQVGHSFLVVCNPLGSKSLLNHIGPKFNDFARIRNLKCFPNLNSDVNISEPLYKTYEDFMSAKNESIQLKLHRRMDILNEVILNECYLDNIDTYK